MSSGPKTANTFSKMAPPQNYVAGVGRGAHGFTTRSDIGPARPAAGVVPETISPLTSNSPFFQPQFGQAPVGYVAGRGRGLGDLASDQGEVGDRGDYSESNYDEFSGYSGSLFSMGTPYEDDDKEADQIYDKVDSQMSNRRKRQKEETLLNGNKHYSNKKLTISEQFADLKHELSTVTTEQWDAIPDVGDHSLKFKQSRKKETFTPAPDSLIQDSLQKGSLVRSLDGKGGLETPSPLGGMTSVAGMAEARGTSLTMKLDKISDSVTGQTVVDPKGYLTDLNSLKITSDAEIGDIKKARTLLSSVTTTNPSHAPGWIAAARVEEFAGKMVQARKIIRQGCEHCPDSEDIWIESARLHTPENAKIILAQAVKCLPTSVKIWLQAAELEGGIDKDRDSEGDEGPTIEGESIIGRRSGLSNLQRRKIVLRRALEFIPNSVKLWKIAIELEDVEDARIMLARAVECVPQSVEMWLALAKLETHENARKILNRAREAIPTEPLTWITAAKLEEAHGNVGIVGKIIEKMMASLAQYQVVVDRGQWIEEAISAEEAGAVATCGAIARNTIHLGVDEEDRMGTWMDDAEACLARIPPAIETARAILAHALTIFPNKKALWLSASMLEKDHGTSEKLENTLKEAVKHCPNAEVLWLMAAKEKWMAGSIPEARAILKEAFSANLKSEAIWLAAVKLEWENNEFPRARGLLARAREQASSEKVWMKSALLEREVGDVPIELSLLETAILKYPSFFKFYLMGGQACDQVLGDHAKAREFYQRGLVSCPNCVPLWVSMVRLEEKSRGSAKARSTLEIARLKLPKNEELLLEAVRLERRDGNEKAGDSLLALALQECPRSGLLWAEELLTCPKAHQKSRSVDALKQCDNDPHVILAVSRLFERDKKYSKARKWFQRTVALNPRLGDAWAHYYAFELRQLQTQQSQALRSSSYSSSSESTTAAVLAATEDEVDSAQAADEILKQCAASNPNRGELWLTVSKQTQFRRKPSGEILKTLVRCLLQSGTRVPSHSLISTVESFLLTADTASTSSSSSPSSS